MNHKTLSIQFDGINLLVIDQTKLPFQEEWVKVTSPEIMVSLIKSLAVRGAPLIGVAAGLSLGLFAHENPDPKKILEKAMLLRNSRPTAVNLMNVIDFLLTKKPEQILSSAIEWLKSDIQMCEDMANHGATLVEHGENILHHCNTGSLATAGIGTALSVIQRAHEQGKKIHVYVDETRPLLQGARLTTWELSKLNIPHTLICDNMAGTLMAQGKIQRVFVGSDRIAMNGDFANKIGTYSVAVLAHHHGVPFHPVAPLSTVDFHCASGAEIPIEERDGNEVRGYKENLWAPTSSRVFNPSFDVTPANLVTSLVLDKGIFTQKDLREGKLKSLF